MKYLSLIILSFVLVSSASASVYNGTVNTDTSVTTGIPEVVLMSKPIANPGAGTYTGTQTVSLSAPGSTSIHYFRNTTDFDSALTCSTGDTTVPVEMTGSGLIRAIACYGSVDSLVAGPMASFDYVISSASTPAPASSGGGGGYTPPSTPPTTDQADFDESGGVDILDFNILISNWGTATGATKATGDATGDGTVDIFDFNILITNWSTV